MRYITRSPNHFYTFDGVEYPGVTGILKVLDKSGPLMSWAARMTAEAAVAALPSLPALLESVGPQGVVKALTARSAWKNEEARDLGTDVHAMADLIATGQPLPAMSELTMKRVDAYEQWWRASGWRLRASEYMVVNPTIGYGGTGDLLCYDRDGRTVLADIKTGKGVYHETALQLAAYGAAEWLDTGDGSLYAMPAVDRYAVIHVTADTVKEIDVVIGKGEVDAFKACMALDRWLKSRKGRAAVNDSAQLDWRDSHPKGDTMTDDTRPVPAGPRLDGCASRRRRPAERDRRPAAATDDCTRRDARQP